MGRVIDWDGHYEPDDIDPEVVNPTCPYCNCDLDSTWILNRLGGDEETTARCPDCGDVFIIYYDEDCDVVRIDTE